MYQLKLDTRKKKVRNFVLTAPRFLQTYDRSIGTI